MCIYIYIYQHKSCRRSACATQKVPKKKHVYIYTHISTQELSMQRMRHAKGPKLLKSSRCSQFTQSFYRVAKTHRMSKVAGHFLQKSH